MSSLITFMQIMGINESPVFLLLSPRVDLARKDLPVSLYETGRNDLCKR